jgi:hypothetical protein
MIWGHNQYIDLVPIGQPFPDQRAGGKEIRLRALILLCTVLLTLLVFLPIALAARLNTLVTSGVITGGICLAFLTTMFAKVPMRRSTASRLRATASDEDMTY